MSGAGASAAAALGDVWPRVSSATGVRRDASSTKGLKMAGSAAGLCVSAWLAGESTEGSAVAALMACVEEAPSVDTAVITGPMLTFFSPVLRLEPWLHGAVEAPAAVVRAPGSLSAAAAA